MIDLSDPDTAMEALVRLALEMKARPEAIHASLSMRSHHSTTVPKRWSVEVGFTCEWMTRIVTDVDAQRADAIAALWKRHHQRRAAGEPTASEDAFSTFNPPFPPHQSSRTERSRVSIRRWNREQRQEMSAHCQRWWMCYRAGAR